MPILQFSRKDENSHIAFYGDTGAGKGLMIKQYLKDVERRGEMAVVWDPDREYARKFRDVCREDWMLDPAVEECPFWKIGAEVEDEADSLAIAKCFLPDAPNSHEPMWQMTAQNFLAYILDVKRPSTSDLGYWMAHDKYLDKIAKGTEFETTLTKGGPGLRSGVIAHMNTAAQPLRMMPSKPDGRRTFTVRDYCNKRQGWVFLTSTPSRSEAMKPLHGMFLGYIIMRIIDMGPRPDLPRIHIVIDEASTLTLSEFHMALVRLRKTETPIVYAIQNFNDLKGPYGEKAYSIFSQPKTKIIGRIGDDNSSEKLANTIGKVKIKRLRETRNYDKGKHTRSLSTEQKEEHLVSQATIQNLPDREAYLIQPGIAVKIKLPIIELPDRMPAIQPRVIPPMEHRPLDPEIDLIDQPEQDSVDEQTATERKPVRMLPRRIPRPGAPSPTLFESASGDQSHPEI